MKQLPSVLSIDITTMITDMKHEHISTCQWVLLTQVQSHVQESAACCGVGYWDKQVLHKEKKKSRLDPWHTCTITLSDIQCSRPSWQIHYFVQKLDNFQIICIHSGTSTWDLAALLGVHVRSTAQCTCMREPLATYTVHVHMQATH